MKNYKYYERQIREIMQDLGTYSPALDNQIKALATALHTLDTAKREASTLQATTIMEAGRYGERIVPHPVFKVMRGAEASVTKQMKALRLTAKDIVGATQQEADPVAEIMAMLNHDK